MEETTSKLFMAFSHAQESKEAGEFEIKRYVGVAPVKILAVNPTKEELENLYGTTLEKDIEYTGTQDVDGGKVDTARIDFIVKTTDSTELVTKVTFFLQKSVVTNKDKTKVQVIDKYGRTAWALMEDAQNKRIPQYANGPADIDANYRPLCRGEEELTNFIRTYLCVESPRFWNKTTSRWETREDLASCEGTLDKLGDYFKGDFSELKDIIKLMPENKVKVLFGVRQTDDNKMYQTTFNRMFLHNNVSKYTRLQDEVKRSKDSGAFSTTTFSNTGDELHNLEEFKVEPTDFNQQTEVHDFPWD